MAFRLGQYATEEGDWEIIGKDWWRTSFRDVPWSYVPRSATKFQRKSFHGPLFCNPPPRPTSSMDKEQNIGDENDSINVDLVGAKTALDAVVAYERDVGFYFTALADVQLEEPRIVDLSQTVDEAELVNLKKKWDDMLDDLMNGPAFDDNDVSSLSSSGELHRSTSTFSNMSSIDSLGMPSTPKPKSIFNGIEIKDLSPTGSTHFHLSPSRSLNAAANSFVPTFCPQLNDEPLQFPTLEAKSKTSAEALSSFTFPTLNSHNPSTRGKKDDQSFFSDSTSPEGGNGLLPPFMQEPGSRTRTRKSRTREIVDRLRSRMAPLGEASSQAQVPSKYVSHSPSPTGDDVAHLPPRLSASEDGGDRVSRMSSPSEENDGWMDASQPSLPSLPSPNHKSQRARELLFALTRRRTDSLTPENVKEMTVEEHAPAQNAPSSPSPSPPIVTSADGWIESSPKPPSEPQKKAKATSTQTHSRKKSSNHVSRTSTSSASHTHSHSHSQQHPQYSSSSGYPSHSAPALPHMLPPQMVPGPYFFPAYSAVNMPMPYSAFMQVPAYHLAMSMQASHMPPANAPMQYAMPPTLGVPLSTGAAMKPANAAVNIGAPPSFRPKHSPVW